MIENEKFMIEGEENLKEFIDTTTLSGTPLSRFFCSTCGKYVLYYYRFFRLVLILKNANPLHTLSPIKSVTPLYIGKSILKLGIFSRIPAPEWESFASQRQSWEVPVPGAIQYKTKSFGEKLDNIT